MAEIRPFKALRPIPERAAEIAALPYDVFSRTEAAEEVRRHPESFLKVDRPEIQFPETTDAGTPEVYEAAGNTLRNMTEMGMLIRDSEPGYYIYTLTWNGKEQSGIVGCIAARDFENGVVCAHEKTRKEKEEDRVQHIRVCKAQTGPVFLLYRHRQELMNRIQKIRQEKQVIYDFIKDDGVRHQVWKISEEHDIEWITRCVKDAGRLYIADGHHRAAAALHLAREQKSEESQYILSVLFSDHEVTVLPYHRLVKKHMDKDEFLKKLSEVCEICPEKEPYSPHEKGNFGLYLEGQWYRLIRRERDDKELDADFLQKKILQPVFDIKDPRSDPNLDFSGGIRGLSELERRVRTDCFAAFSMCAVSLQELFQVADRQEMMPPKSTWFEPKLLSGIFIHSL